MYYYCRVTITLPDALYYDFKLYCLISQIGKNTYLLIGLNDVLNSISKDYFQLYWSSGMVEEFKVPNQGKKPLSFGI